MKRPLAAFALVALVAAPAAAEPKPKSVADTVLDAFTEGLTYGGTSPKFAFKLGDDSAVDPKQEELETQFELGFGVKKPTVGISGDGKTAWVATHMAWYEPCGDETCPRVPKPDGFYQGSMVLEDKGGWKPVAWHVASPTDAKLQAQLLKDGAEPTAIARAVRKGAEEAVAAFEASIGDPRALARTVSSRTDVALFGSDLKERYTGGKKVAATLAKWNLAFEVRDGVQAGASAAGDVVWIAANVDATSVKKPGGKPTPYRVFCVYEKSFGGWKLVLMHFSFVD